MLSKIRLYIYGAIAGALAILIGLVYKKGMKDVNDKETLRKIEAMMEAKDIRHDVEISDDQYLVDVLTGKLHK